MRHRLPHALDETTQIAAAFHEAFRQRGREYGQPVNDVPFHVMPADYRRCMFDVVADLIRAGVIGGNHWQ